MRAILVIDMPESCDDCQLAYDYRCFITWKEFEEKEENYIISYPRPTWCPLKPMPKKFNDDVYEDWMFFDKELVE